MILVDHRLSARIDASFEGGRGANMAATPFYNSWATNVTYFTPPSVGNGRYVADGEKWGGALGMGISLSYSFPGASVLGNYAYYKSAYGYEYAKGKGEWEDLNGNSRWYHLTSAEQSAVTTALNTWSKFANVTFQQVADSSTTVGEMRFALSDALGTNVAAHAYYPDKSAEGGDVWFNPAHFNTDGGGVPLGSYDFLTILHEIGHALGLKHPFDASNNGGGNIMPAALDNYFYTIMSYTASPWSAHGDNWASFYPTTPMYYDLLAIEGMYGRRPYAPGDNSYTFYDGVKYWQAIHDTGGTDRIVYIGAEAAIINLNPGQFSSLSEAIQFQRPNGTIATSKATVTIGPNVLIENAVGGRGNDLLIGNTANNVLNGGDGNDTLRPIQGNDTLTGGAGRDIFFFNTSPNNLTNHDRITDYNPAADTIQLENAVFTKLGAAGHTLNAAFFWAGAAAHDGNDYIVYNRSTGDLFYDLNANAAGSALLIANFANKPLLAASEFAIV